MRQTLKYCACALVLLLAVASTIFWATLRGESYETTLVDYLEEGRQFTIADVSPERTDELLVYLQTQVQERPVAFVRADEKLSVKDGSPSGLHLGVLFSPGQSAILPSLDYLGTPLLYSQ